MEKGNQRVGITFILLDFSEYPHLQAPLFLVFLAIYTASVVGNVCVIVIIRINPQLLTPMYFFLSHLSFLDFCFCSASTPKLLEILVVDIRTISYMGCMMQFFFGCTFVIIEMFILAVMAYDRFVAVCNPLLYRVAMSPKLFTLLVDAAYTWGGFCSLTLTCSLSELCFCSSNIINHFGCEYSAILSASCSDTYFNLMLSFIISTFNEACSLLIILFPCLFIVVMIIKMPFAGGSTRSSLFIKIATVFYTVVIPMLNPLIYSLRNNDVKILVRKLINDKQLFSHSV
uniref:Olfactory receptor n=1 Tax=Catagonus wagneri TaxID=51154 RepID=A0A8C3XBZ6_9CETA